MKIGSRIALFYTIITVGAIAAVVMVFYFFTSRYINHLYDSYLIEKAYLTAQKHWEKDEVDEYSYREIQQKYDELLPQAQEILLNTDSASAAVNDTLNKYLDSNQQARLFKDFPVPFVYGNLRGAALHYPPARPVPAADELRTHLSHRKNLCQPHSASPETHAQRVEAHPWKQPEHTDENVRQQG